MYVVVKMDCCGLEFGGIISKVIGPFDTEKDARYYRESLEEKEKGEYGTEFYIRDLNSPE